MNVNSADYDLQPENWHSTRESINQSKYQITAKQFYSDEIKMKIYSWALGLLWRLRKNAFC